MPTIIESGITLNFPDNNYFRFQDCQGYKMLQYLKEMDVCWYDQANDILYLIELKDWGDGTLQEENDAAYTAPMIQEKKTGITTYRIKELVKKSLDSACMICAILLNKPYSAQFNPCIPFSISPNTTLKLLSIINWANIDTTYISSIHTEYKTQFKSYSKLFGINTYVVMTRAQAAAIYSWIT